MILNSKQIEYVNKVPISAYYGTDVGKKIIISSWPIEFKNSKNRKYCWMAVLHLFNSTLVEEVVIKDLPSDKGRIGADTLKRYGLSTKYSTNEKYYTETLYVTR